MLIRVINGFYDYEKNRIIEKDEVLELDDEKADGLISLGLVVEADKTPEEDPENEAEETPEEDPENEADKAPKKNK